MNLDDIPKDIQEKINDLLRNNKGISGVIEIHKQKNNETNVNEHYGVSNKTFTLWIKQIICDMVMTNDKTKILDKWFNKDDELQETRVKVLAFNAAEKYFMRMEMDE